MRTYAEFWPHYVGAHRSPANRALHYAGTLSAVGLLVAAAVTGEPLLVLAAPLVGYGLAWAGHFLVEGNRPATFGHPLWSLYSDFRMLAFAVRGRMRAEVERLGS